MTNRPTALITGASSGIGAEFAKQLSSLGYDLVLAARRVDRMEALAAELRKAHGVGVKVVAADLAQSGAAAALSSQIGDTSIDFLVNNAGFGQVGKFSLEDPTVTKDELFVNIFALTELTRIYLPKMVARGAGTIVNIASTAAYQPVPNMAVYAATKAYVLSFTEAIWTETQGTGVKVLAVSPGGTETEFFEVAGARLSSGALAKPQEVVSAAMTALAKSEKSPSVIVGTGNKLMANATRFAPRRLVLSLANRIMKPKK
ncbi:MAG: SDR family NAD(P)-dependent oxidoreductase [Actinomycetota bacterium]